MKSKAIRLHDSVQNDSVKIGSSPPLTLFDDCSARHAGRPELLLGRIPPVAVAAALLLSTSGCGTCQNVRSHYEPGNEIVLSGWTTPDREIYGGVEHDARLGAGLIVHETFNDWWAAPVGLYLLGIDLPLCLLGDTLTLPITVPASIDRAVREYYFPDRAREPKTDSEPE